MPSKVLYPTNPPINIDLTILGVHGVVHVASNLSFSEDPNAVIPEVIAGIDGILESATHEPMIKRFVFTSSSTAATNPKPNTKFNIDANTWNNETVERAWAPPPYEKARRWDVYGASKTQAEQALWKFMDEKKPHFEANAVLPNANFGPILSPQNQKDASTANWVTTTYETGPGDLASIPPQYFVDVRDTCKLHIAALVDEDIKSERIFAFAETFTWNQLLGVLRKLRPQRKFAEDVPDNGRDLSVVVKQGRAVEILNKNFGQSAWTPLEESVKVNIAHLD